MVTEQRLVAVIFAGEGYIPPSVRESLLHPPAFLHPSFGECSHSWKLALEEDLSEVHLYLPVTTKEQNNPAFLRSFEEFAEEWRCYLDGESHKDLLPVRK